MKVTRSRVIEDTSGEGGLHTDLQTNLLPVKYRLTVEVEQVKAGDEWLDGTREIEAKIEGVPEAAVIRLVDDEMPMVLYLADGRTFACVMQDYSGRAEARGDNASPIRSAVGASSPRRLTNASATVTRRVAVITAPSFGVGEGTV